jgi:energy-coupling factor transporter ATP-binding protein EcfA2
MPLQVTYQLALIDHETSTTVDPSHLSSGERALFGLFLWIFTSGEYQKLPRLLLLDEPDSHLHTAQIPGFFGGLQSLTEKYDCQIIMSTHRVDTIALAPKGSVFEMRRIGPDRIRPVVDRTRILSTVTAGVLDVLPSARCVFVEDEGDVEFYSEARTLAEDQKWLPSKPPLTFLTPAIGTGKSRETGGCKKVSAWVERLRPKLGGIVQGLVDGDGNEDLSPDGVIRLRRHSVENYLYDPLLVFAVLADVGDPVATNGLPAGIAKGQGQTICSLDAKHIQIGISNICGAVERHLKPEVLSASNEATVEAVYCRPGSGSIAAEVKVQVPRWVIAARGHDIAGAYQ